MSFIPKRAVIGSSPTSPSSVVHFNRMFNTTISNKQHSNSIKQKYEFSKPFYDLCYQHLLIGQHKQQALWHWLRTSQKITNWKIHENTFSLISETNQSIDIPLQLIGTYSSNTNSFLFAFNNESLDMKQTSIICNIAERFPDIIEFQKNKVLENQMSSDIGYILSSVILSLLNMNNSGYYACPLSTIADQHLFVFLNDMMEHGYNEREWLSFKSMDIFNIFGNTVYRLSRECNIHMGNHLYLFECFFKSYGIIYKIERMSKHVVIEEGVEVEEEIQRLVILESDGFEIDSAYYEFDKGGRFQNIGIPLSDNEV